MRLHCYKYQGPGPVPRPRQPTKHIHALLIACLWHACLPQCLVCRSDADSARERPRAARKGLRAREECALDSVMAARLPPRGAASGGGSGRGWRRLRASASCRSASARGAGGTDPSAGGGGRRLRHQPRRRAVLLLAAGASLAAVSARPRRAETPTAGPQQGVGSASASTQAASAQALKVGVVVPAFNEAARIEDTLAALRALRPAPHIVVVADSFSPDGTARVARRAARRVRSGGAWCEVAVVQADKRGRAAQMNVGAARARAAGADAVLFCHADTSPPQGAVAAVRAVLGDQTCCLGAFLPLIVSDGAGANSGADATAPAAGRQRTYWLLSAHNWIKSYYCPLLARPISFFRGLRLFFGDQCMFTRLDDFAAVGGFDEALPLMEDSTLCVRMHTHCRQEGRGRLRMVGRVAETSARRFDAFGEVCFAWRIFGADLHLARKFWQRPSLPLPFSDANASRLSLRHAACCTAGAHDCGALPSWAVLVRRRGVPRRHVARAAQEAMRQAVPQCKIVAAGWLFGARARSRRAMAAQGDHHPCVYLLPCVTVARD